MPTCHRRCLQPCIAAVLGLLMAATVQAQAGGGVYRCGASYSAAPCPGGTPLVLDDAPTPAQRQQALAAAQQDQRLATQLAAERRARERAAIGQQAARIGPSAQERAHAEAVQAKAQAQAAAKRKKLNKPRRPGTT
jgi:hypothetical protein